MMLLSFLAQLDASGNMESGKYSPILIGQLINILIALGSAAVGWKILSRQPPLGEELLKMKAESQALSVRIEVVEKWLARIEGDTGGDIDGIRDRLKEGDDLFKKELADLASVKTTVEHISQDVHMLKTQMNNLIARPRK